jgi:Thrombospondin C-terminal region/PEP-CTERM motif
MKSVVVVTALAASFAVASQAQVVPIDLNTWTERGPASNGTWTVSPDGTTVTQSINGNPTFFVGGPSFIDTVLRGSIRVTGGDDDFIGFVMGYSSPTGTGNDMNYVLLDWKERDQSASGFLAREGFAVSRVNGTITDYAPGFWGHTESASFDVLQSNFSSTNGWQPNTTYDFAITYRSDRVTVVLTGGSFGTPTTVLDVTGNFPAGQFGFYNFSQAGVVYSGFTVESAPPTDPPPVPGIPEPSTYVLMLAGLGAVVASVRRTRRRER